MHFVPHPMPAPHQVYTSSIPSLYLVYIKSIFGPYLGRRLCKAKVVYFLIFFLVDKHKLYLSTMNVLRYYLFLIT